MEYKFKSIKHPIFGEIITTTDGNGKTLYKAITIAQAIGFNHYGQRLKGLIDFKIIPMMHRNSLGYITRNKIRYISEEDIPIMIDKLLVLETKKLQKQHDKLVELLKR